MDEATDLETERLKGGAATSALETELKAAPLRHTWTHACGLLLRAGLLVLVGFALGTQWRTPSCAPCESCGAAVIGDAANATDGDDAHASSYAFLRTPKGTRAVADAIAELDANGPAAALRLVRSRMAADAQVADSCHPLIHKVGQHAFRTRGFPAAYDGVIPGSPGAEPALLRMCNAAYLHGVQEFYLASAEDLPAAVQSMYRDVCDKITGLPNGMWECSHGVGHGVLQHFRRDADAQALSRSLATCDALQTSHPSEVGNAVNGLWMDHFAATRFSDEDDGAAFADACDRFGGAHMSTCVMYVPTAVLLLRPRDYGFALRVCADRWGDEPFKRNMCVFGAGAQIGKENMADLGAAERACLLADGRGDARTCVSGVVSYWKTAEGRSPPAEVCAQLTRFRSLCH